MSGFKLVTCCISLFAVSSLPADELPFDAPLYEITPLLEEADFLDSPSMSDAMTSSFQEEFRALPLLYAEEDDMNTAPDFVKASFTFSSSPESMRQSQGDEVRDLLVLSPATTPMNTSISETPTPPQIAPTSSTASMPIPRVESAQAPAQIDMREVFAGAPLIYSVLLAISMATVALWSYTQLNMRTEKLMPQAVVANLQEKIQAGKVEEALALCKKDTSLLGRMMRSGLLTSRTSQEEILAAMQNEGKRLTGGFWQKLALLNDVAIIAPMIGLLGTVVGMFYAFYDINRSVESMNSLFDGLGISVGTTVAGLILAIAALVMHSTSKYRLVKQLAQVESTAHNLAANLHQRKEE